MSPMEALLMTHRDDASAERVMTRFKSLTLPYRQRSGKRVICVIQAGPMTRCLKDVVARAHVRARKGINPAKAETRHLGGAR